MKEISYIHAEGYPAGEMKHGPIALIDDADVRGGAVPAWRTYEKMLSNVQEVRPGAGTGDRGGLSGRLRLRRVWSRNAITVIEIPDVDELFSPLLTVCTADPGVSRGRARRRDVDQPRNLANRSRSIVSDLSQDLSAEQRARGPRARRVRC
jgi:glucosamine--fructose-6-phosphate aminotransferase (isomerizing)